MKCYSNNVRLVLGILILLHFQNILKAQVDSVDLQFTDLGKKIENRIQIFISNSEYNNIKTSKGEKISLKNPLTILNEDTVIVKDIHLRGQSSLYLRRKSFNIKADKKMFMHYNDERLGFKELLVVSLSMDKNYIRNRLSFELMQKLQLFNLVYSYAELKINGNTEGIYMIVESPTEWALKNQNSPMVIRRGYNHKIEKLKSGKHIEKAEEKYYRNQYESIYQAINKFSGKELYDRLNELMDVKMYMRWLAFNYFVRNGDYSDEVFWYIDPDDNKFKVIPWDYDDIFAKQPHEGRRQSIGEKYIFSSEDNLDRKIASDPYLDSVYLSCLHDVITKLTVSVIKRVLEKTYAELFPFFSDSEIIGMSRYDVYEKDNLGSLAQDLRTIFINLMLTRNSLLHELE